MWRSDKNLCIISLFFHLSMGSQVDLTCPDFLSKKFCWAFLPPHLLFFCLLACFSIMSKILLLAFFRMAHGSYPEIPWFSYSQLRTWPLYWIYFLVLCCFVVYDEGLGFLHKQGYFFALSNLKDFYFFFLSITSGMWWTEAIHMGTLLCRTLTLDQVMFQLFQ